MPVRADAIANRDRILTAARCVFAEAGIDAEVKDIADRAGLGVGTIYRNFPTKHGLLVEVIRTMMGDVAARFSEAEDLDDPIDGLHLALSSMYQAAVRNGWIMEAKLNGRLPEEVRSIFPPPARDARMQALHRLVVRAQDAGQIRRDAEPRVIITLLLGSVSPIMHGILGEDAVMPDTASLVLDSLLQGVGVPVPGVDTAGIVTVEGERVA